MRADRVICLASAIALVALVAGNARAQLIGASAGRSPLVRGPAPLSTGGTPPPTPTGSNRGWWSTTPASVAPLPVPLINQNDPRDGGPLPNGCEATSLTMLLRYAGADVNKGGVFARFPTSADPNTGFTGAGVYHGPIAATAQGIVNDQHLPVRIVDYTGQSLDQVLGSTVARGRPVQIVTNATYRPLSYPVNPKMIPPDEHSVVIVGYTPDTVTIRDPLLSRNNSYPNSNGTLTLPRSQFEAAWNQMGRQAISYEPIP